MAENEPPALPPGPSGTPGPDDPTPPRGLARPGPDAGAQPAMDAEEYRRFQEFQRFQDYQRFVEAQGPTGRPPVPMPPVPVPAHPGHQPGQHEQALQVQLDGMRQQLTRIERIANPPLWRKILRNKWLHRAAWLVIVIILATWGVPRLVHHYLGGGDAGPPGSAALPAPNVPASGELETANQTVKDVYEFIAEDEGTNLCGITMTSAAADEFAGDHGHPGNCSAAVAALYSALGQDGVSNYLQVSLTQLRPPAGNTFRVSSCQLAQVIDPPGVPALGTFTLTRQAPGEDAWRITGYQLPTQCSAAPSESTPPR